mgnify:FL=1
MKYFFTHRAFLIFLGFCYPYAAIVAQKELMAGSQNSLPLDLLERSISSESYETVGIFDVDIEGDGKKELSTGKRYRAYNGKEPGGKEHTGRYYFKWNGESFSNQVIDYGPHGTGKGTGVYFSVNGNEKKDIIVAGKDGLNIYYNQSYED